MGRPIHKKYFGNRNIGTVSTTDNGIGGEGVASFGTIVAGTGSTTDQDAYVSNPTLPGGVTATIQAHYKALSFATTANGTGYNVGDVLEVTTGTAATKARAPVASVVGLNEAPTISDDGTNYDSGDLVTFTNANLSQSMKVRITTAVAGDATVVTIEQQPIWIGSGTAPTTTAGWTATTTEGPIDNNGAGLVLTGLTWGVYSFGTVSVAGDYTVFPSTNDALTSVTPATGTGARADITMGLLSVTVLTRGSGYASPSDAELLFDGSANGASAVAVLTTDSGNVGSLTNQENAIIVRANTIGEGALVGDIQKQVAARRYKVKTADGIAKCKLVADDTPATREAYIVATSEAGGTYWVTKLTSHRATLVARTGDDALDGQAVAWSFAAPDGARVQIENA